MATNGIPLDKAELLSTLLEGILYGFSLLMFGGTIWKLLCQRSTQKVNRKMFTAACLLLLCSTVHLIIDIIRIVDGLILYRDTYPGGPIAFFASVSQWTFVTKNYLYTVQSLIGDGVILYRCYVVWQSKFVMILPALLWCAAGVTGIGSPYTASQTPPSGTDVFSGSIARWIKAFYATTFATNVLTTSLLAYRIWYLDQKTAKLRGHSRSQLREILHTIIDAGVIYFLTLLAVMICFSLRSNGQYVILNMIVPIISITFYMVIIRVGLFSNRVTQPRNVLSRRYTSAVNSLCAEARNRMQVRITTLTEHKVDDGRCSPVPMSPITAINNKSCPGRSNIGFDNAEEVV